MANAAAGVPTSRLVITKSVKAMIFSTSWWWICAVSIIITTVLQDKTFFIDLKLNDFDSFNFHPLVNTATINIKRNDFYSFLKTNDITINLFSFETYNTYDIKES